MALRGRPIGAVEDLGRWLADNGSSLTPAGQVVATFVVGSDGRLYLADRHSEHIACSGGRPVRSAGEIFFAGDGGEVDEVSNQSTGFCPEPESWEAVAQALDRIGIPHPGRFTAEFNFRRCPACGERNLVKEAIFECLLCGDELPQAWNFN
ncbi:hypothetical protein V5E97_33050 [Singulisphaera sp. Ch08]|uniref:Uncharacterized protein n=1 Tax=Singulisphaera sp. Ch08 TaxID=3120278 RepID=A0AAU7CCF0_9BACT